MQFAASGGVEWTIGHRFYADMGGLAIRVRLPRHLSRSLEPGGDEMDGNLGKHSVPTATISGLVSLILSCSFDSM